MADSGSNPTKGTLFYVDYTPATTDGIHTVTVGAEAVGGSDGGTQDKLKLSPNDKEIKIRVYVDNTFSECYWQHGRVAMTITTPATPQAAMAVTATGAVSLQSAEAYAVNSIWVAPKDVTDTPRKK